METIKEAAYIYAQDFWYKEDPRKNDLQVANKADTGFCIEEVGFPAGVAWAERWIPVTEALPEDGILVITMCEEGNDRFFGIAESNKGHLPQLRCGKGVGDIWHSLTHWRPIEHK